MGILIRGANGDAQSTQESSNPALSTEMRNRTRKLKCSQVDCTRIFSNSIHSVLLGGINKFDALSSSM